MFNDDKSHCKPFPIVSYCNKSMELFFLHRCIVRVRSFVSDSINMLNNPLHHGHEAITLAINFEALTQLYPCASPADELKISPG